MVNKACGICGRHKKSVCASCCLQNQSDLQVQVTELKRSMEGFTVWVNEVLEKCAVQLTNDGFRVLKREET